MKGRTGRDAACVRDVTSRKIKQNYGIYPTGELSAVVPESVMGRNDEIQHLSLGSRCLILFKYTPRVANIPKTSGVMLVRLHLAGLCHGGTR